jgi:hypothetical protein
MYQDHENAEFAFFMRKVNNLIVRLTGLSVDDFADAMWYDLFEETEGKPTREDIIDTLADADCIFAAMMQEQAA